MKKQKSDGTIEIRNSSCGCCPPPGHEKKQMHTNNGSTWWRIGEGEWHRIDKSKIMDAYEFAQASETVSEFKSIMS